VRSPVLMKHSLYCSIASASPAAVRHLCRAAVRPVSATNGEVVFEKGDACSRVLLVYEGSLMYGQPWGTSSELKCDDDGDSVSAEVAPEHRPPNVQCGEVVEAGASLSEPALFVNWVNRGRLVADSLSYMYSLEVTEFSQVIVKHFDAYASVVLYARKFVRELNEDPAPPSDVPSFQVVTSSLECERTWYVSIISASGLRNADFFLMGTSDPYCTCQVRGLKNHSASTRVKTDVIPNSLEPVWNESFELTFRGDHSFEFDVWDRDIFPKKDELLGHARVSSAQLAGGTFDGMLKLEGKKATGFLKVRISTTPLADP
jgi:hypothetical protein